MFDRKFQTKKWAPLFCERLDSKVLTWWLPLNNLGKVPGQSRIPKPHSSKVEKIPLHFLAAKILWNLAHHYAQNHPPTSILAGFLLLKTSHVLEPKIKVRLVLLRSLCQSWKGAIWHLGVGVLSIFLASFRRHSSKWSQNLCVPDNAHDNAPFKKSALVRVKHDFYYKAEFGS